MKEKSKTIHEVCREIIEEMEEAEPLTADAACRLIERLDTEVMARGAPAELGYSLLYTLVEHLVLHLQGRGILEGDCTCK